jgi:hypothetical protein
MNLLSETTINLLLSAFLGAIIIPINAWIQWKLKRSEQDHQHKLNILTLEKELALRHKLEMKRIQNDNYHTEIIQLKEALHNIELRLERQERRGSK